MEEQILLWLGTIIGLLILAKPLAMAIVKLTPTPKDNVFIGKVYSVVEKVAELKLPSKKDAAKLLVLSACLLAPISLGGCEATPVALSDVENVEQADQAVADAQDVFIAALGTLNQAKLLGLIDPAEDQEITRIVVLLNAAFDEYYTLREANDPDVITLARNVLARNSKVLESFHIKYAGEITEALAGPASL